MPKTSVDLDEEGFKAYRELVDYLKAKHGKYRGLISLEVSKAIQLYLQQLKATEGSPQTSQSQFTTEKAEESKPVRRKETTKSIEKRVEELSKRVEDLEKELKATEDTVKGFMKSIENIDEYIKQRTLDATKGLKVVLAEGILERIKEKVKRELEDEFKKKNLNITQLAEDLLNHMTFCRDCQEGLIHVLGPILTKYKEEIKEDILKEIYLRR